MILNVPYSWQADPHSQSPYSATQQYRPSIVSLVALERDYHPPSLQNSLFKTVMPFHMSRIFEFLFFWHISITVLHLIPVDHWCIHSFDVRSSWLSVSCGNIFKGYELLPKVLTEGAGLAAICGDWKYTRCEGSQISVPDHSLSNCASLPPAMANFF